MAKAGLLRVCPRCRPIGTKVTYRDGRHLGFVPEALYVGYLVGRRGLYKTPPKVCPACGTELQMKALGQALVEFALITPILLFTILGGVEAGFLLITKADQDRATAVIAQWAAMHPGESWNSVANKELPECTVEVKESSPDLLEATSRCLYSPKVLVGFPIFSGLPISSHETAALPKKDPSPDPSPSPAASPS